MLSHDLQILIERAARGELGDAESVALAQRAKADRAVSQALADAKVEYTMFTKTADHAFSPEDLPAIREAIRARALTERRTALLWMVVLPVLSILLAALVLAGMEGTTTDGFVRVIASVLGFSLLGSGAVWCWWRWYRSRAARAASGDVGAVEAWVHSRGRGATRESYIHLVGVLIMFVLIPIKVVRDVLAADWSSAAFWVGFLVVIWLLGLLLERIEQRRGG